jgi:hypothetical protein
MPIMNDSSSPVQKPMTWFWVVLLCFGAFLFKVYVRYGPPDYLFFGDSNTGLPRSDAVTWYLHGVNLFEGRGVGDVIHQFIYRNFVPPGHPFILANLMVWLGTDPVTLGWAVAVLTSLLPAVMFLWGREMFGPRVGLWMAGLAAVHPPFTHVGFSLMAEPTSVLAMAFTYYLGARAVKRNRYRDVALAGLSFGLTGLIRPAVLAFLWGGLLMVALGPCRTLRGKINRIGLWLLLAMVPLLLWQVRNRQVHGEWSFVYSSISARHIWTGANPEFGPYFYSRGSMHHTIWRDPRATEMEYIRRMQAEADEWIRQNRVHFVMSSIWRLNGLLPEFRSVNSTIIFDQSGWRALYLRLLVILAVPGVAAALLTRVSEKTPGQSSSIPGYVWTAGIAFGLLISIWGAGVYGASYRYRWPLELAWIPFASVFLHRLTHIQTVPIFAFRQEVYSLPALGGAARKGLRGLYVLLLVMVMASTVTVIYRQINPLAPATPLSRLSEEELLQWIEDAGLYPLWSRQEPMWVEYRDVFEEQAANYGAVRGLNGSWVAWWGILRIVDSRDNIFRSAELLLEAEPGTLGIARLPIVLNRDAPPIPGAWQDGQVVTVLGQLQFEDRSLASPVIHVNAIREVLPP